MSEKTHKPKLSAVTSLTKDRDQEIIEKLNVFVKLAEEGVLSDIAIVCKVRGEPMTEFDWDSDNPLELIGALYLAQQEVAMDMLHEAEAEEDDEGL
jgi:hypothetical protein